MEGDCDPYSDSRIPESLVKGFESLDESAAWLGQIPPDGKAKTAEPSASPDRPGG